MDAIPLSNYQICLREICIGSEPENSAHHYYDHSPRVSFKQPKITELELLYPDSPQLWSVHAPPLLQISASSVQEKIHLLPHAQLPYSQDRY
jgi:hypothetical protein